MTEKNYSDREKLQVLLGHWLQHNESHGKEYLRWAEKAREGGHAAAAGFIEQAVGLLRESDALLKKALETVGGPGPGHPHHHHHHHHNDKG